MEFIKAICTLISSLLSLYSLALCIRILLTWFPRISPNSLTQVLCRITDPFLNFFRRARFLRFGMLDLSPLLGFLVLNLSQSIFSVLGYQGVISARQILGLIIQGLWKFLGSYVFVIVGIILLVRLLITNNLSPTATAIKNALDPKLDPYISWVYRTFFKTRGAKENIIVATAFGLEAGVGIILNIAINALINFLLYA